MAIKNKFIHFNTRAGFDAQMSDPTDKTHDFYNYTVFIKDTQEIYTHGQFYSAYDTRVDSTNLKTINGESLIYENDDISNIDILVTTHHPSNEIWYTTTDNVLLTPYASDVFGANLIKNVYVNGRGVMTFDAPVTTIGEKAFYNCKTLKEIAFPDSITTLGPSAFEYCSKLTNITLPQEITAIPDRLFVSCGALKSLEIPDSVTSIGNASLNGGFIVLSIPDGVTSIGDFAFGTYLEELYLKSNQFIPGIAYNAIYSNSTLYVPNELLELYKSDSNWNALFKGNIIGVEFGNTTHVKEGIFKTVNNQSIVGPGNVNTNAYVEILYADLKALRDAGELLPGAWYRITDYDTTTVQENTQAAGHPFDVIVLATSPNTLSHNALAEKSARDGEVSGWTVETVVSGSVSDTKAFTLSNKLIDVYGTNVLLSVIEGNLAAAPLLKRTGDMTWVDHAGVVYTATVQNPELGNTLTDANGTEYAVAHSERAWYAFESSETTSDSTVKILVHDSLPTTTPGVSELDGSTPEYFKLVSGSDNVYLPSIYLALMSETHINVTEVLRNEYFANANLNAWQLWYDIDNDVTKYAWADEVNGKGVIYRMIDEWNNDCPYDFKNIMFKPTLATDTYYDFYFTFHNIENSTDFSLSGHVTINTIHMNDKRLPNCVFIKYGTNNNVTFNTIEIDNSRNNLIIVGGSIIHAHFSVVYNSVFECGGYFEYNTINSWTNGKIAAASNIAVVRITDGSNSSIIALNGMITDLTTGVDFNDNRITSNKNIVSLTCGYVFKNNVIESSTIQLVRFGDNCLNNNITGGHFVQSTVGDNFRDNILKGEFNMVEIGPYFRYNNITASMYYCKIGTMVQNNSTREGSTIDSPLLGDDYYFLYVELKSGTSYNIFNFTTTGYAKYLDISTVGSSDQYNVISLTPSDTTARTKIAQNSRGEIKQYCEADLIA